MKKLAIKERVNFFADEGETQELFHIQARTFLDTGGSKYDVVAGGGTRWASDTESKIGRPTRGPWRRGQVARDAPRGTL